MKLTASGPRWTGEVRQAPASVILQPLRWSSTPRVVFVDSMSDLFHEEVPFPFIAAIFAIMAATPWHHYIILTKRAERLPAFFTWLASDGRRWWECGCRQPFQSLAHHLQALLEAAADQGALRDDDAHLPSDVAHLTAWPLTNVALGVSVERQKEADERIPFLLEAEAAVRLVSYEPALDGVDLGPFLRRIEWPSTFAAGGRAYTLRHLNWVIVGGESGQRARPFDIAWARSAVEQCRRAGVPVFVKQLGAKPFGELSGPWKLRDRKGGDWSEWPEDLRVREAPPGFAAAGEVAP